MRRKSLSYIPTPNSPTRLSTTHVWKRLSSSARFVVPSLSLPPSGQAGGRQCRSRFRDRRPRLKAPEYPCGTNVYLRGMGPAKRPRKEIRQWDDLPERLLPPHFSCSE